MAIGVFGLQVAYRLKRLEVMSTDDTHGWFGGGGVSGVVSTVDRIDFSNDTAITNIRSPLSSTRTQLAATGNSNYGWFGGGYTPPSIRSTVDRIDFSNDVATASPRGPLSSARGYLVATGNSNYGWFGGGRTGSASPFTTVSTVERINFSNDSGTTSPRGPLTLEKLTVAATGNSNYGWFGGGRGGSPLAAISTVDRIDFSNDSGTASVRGPLTINEGGLSATGNSNYGWFVGGNSTTTVNRIDFSNDSSTASVRGPLIIGRGNNSGSVSNLNYGWFGGGRTPGPVNTSIVDRIDFSNDLALSSIRGPLSSVRYNLGATSGQAKGPAIKLQKAGNYGWFGGGFTGVAVATVDRIDFSNDSSTASPPRGPLSSARNNLAATGNSNYGWFGGGSTGVPVATVDRIDFSNDSSTASPRGPLSAVRRQLTATGNSNYGWFGGGSSGPVSIVSTVDRIDFSNDSSTASPRGPLSLARRHLTATGNSNYGWFGGGATGTSPPFVSSATVDRIDFSNDSVSASPRGPLSLERGYLAATGNSNYGWFGGGGAVSLPTPIVPIVDRIDFSNDSVSASPRGPLSAARYELAAAGNSNYGWFGGGYNAASEATVDRINFANDSVSASVRGPLSSARFFLAATSNTHIG